MSSAAATIDLCLLSHTNAGKTTLARTLLARDIGEVRDAPHVTEIAESHVLLETPQGDVLRLWDTPGFGDSVRLVKRLTAAANPIGWMLREIWDRYRDRPLWCSQQAMRAARESTDVVLYLANAAEDPRDAAYVAAEMQILAWIGKPVVLLLNQVGPPKPPVEERAEEQRWREHVEPLGVVREVLTLDAFARCWVQEGVLLRAVEKYVPEEKRASFARLAEAWDRRSLDRFDAAMVVVTEQIARAASDREPLGAAAPKGVVRQVLRSIGFGGKGSSAERERAIDALALRLDHETREATQQLISLHGLEGSASALVIQRLREHMADPGHIGEGRAAALGGILSGALTGLAADLHLGGLTLGAGMITGGILGALGGAAVARGYNLIHGADQPALGWGAASLDALAAAAILRYLAVAHFGRGRGRYVEGEAPAFWLGVVSGVVANYTDSLHELWEQAARGESAVQVRFDLQQILAGVTLEILEKLYPGMVGSAVQG